MTFIAPSILSADFGQLAREVQAAEEAGADWIHVDVMDGHFVPNITIGPLVASAVRKATSLPLDAHLMIESPERYVGDFIDAGVNRITVHQETCPHLHRTLQQIRELGGLPGVALNPSTPVESLREVLSSVELVLVMTVNPGFGGQELHPRLYGEDQKNEGASGRPRTEGGSRGGGRGNRPGDGPCGRRRRSLGPGSRLCGLPPSTRRRGGHSRPAVLPGPGTVSERR